MFNYQLRIEQDLEDGTYHDDDEAAGSLCIDIGDIVGETSKSIVTRIPVCKKQWKT